MSSSSSFVPTGTTSSTSSSTATSSSTGGSSGGNSSANYFFGFLITFIALLLIFVGCGIGSRRGFRIHTGGAWDEAVQRAKIVEKQTRPAFWETWLKNLDDQESWRWRAIMPISATLMRGDPNSRIKEEETSGYSEESATSDGVVAPVSISGLRPRALRSLIPGRRKNKIPDKPDGPPKSVQVAVMIAMPSPTRLNNNTSVMEGSSQQRQQPSTGELGEYQIGVISVPWEHGELAQ